MNKETEIKKTEIKPIEEDFFFPGGGDYLPQTVKAVNQQEALKVYEKTKKPVK